MNAPVIAFVGISGVGKTTFLRSLGEHVSFQHLTGGSLISAGRQSPEMVRDTLRFANLDENQRLLLQGFSLKHDEFAQLIIMDGHVVIDTDDELQKISIDVFKELRIKMMVHLEANPILIAQNRDQDRARNRPVHPIDVLSKHQKISERRAKEIAIALGVEFVDVNYEDVQTFGEQMARRLKDWKG